MILSPDTVLLKEKTGKNVEPKWRKDHVCESFRAFETTRSDSKSHLNSNKDIDAMFHEVISKFCGYWKRCDLAKKRHFSAHIEIMCASEKQNKRLKKVI